MSRVTLPTLPANGNYVDAVQLDNIFNALLAGVNSVDNTQLAVGAALANIGTNGVTSQYLALANNLTQIGWYSVKDYGATGQGVGDDSSGVTAAITAATTGSIGSTTAGVYFPPGTYLLYSSFTVTVPIVMAPGAIIEMAASHTFTVSGPFTASLQQCFSTALAGNASTIFTTGVTVFPEWWGAVGNGSTNDQVAIQAAINAYPSGFGTIAFQAKKYVVGTTLTITNAQSSLTLVGQGSWRSTGSESVIESSSTTAVVLTLTGTSGTLENVRLVGLGFSRTAMGALASYSIYASGMTNWYITDCSWSNSQYGLYINGGNGPYILRCNASNQGQIASNPCYGIYMTGAVTALNGINIDGLVYYGQTGTPTGTLYAFYLTTSSGSSGDIRIANLEVTNNVNYGIYMVDASGFSDDVQFERFTMDAILNAGITLTSVSNQNYQMAAITSGWINLVNTSGTAYGVITTLRSGTMLSNVKIANSGTGSAANHAISFAGAQYGLISNTYLTGSAWTVCVEYILSGAVRSDSNMINGLTVAQIGSQGAINLTACSSGAVVNVLSPNSTLTVAAGSNYNRLYCIVVGSYVNNGTGTVQV